jgi:hypothetical protein
MILQDGVTQVCPVEVGIDLRCSNGFMSQHFLHSPEIGASFNEDGWQKNAGTYAD